MSNETLEQRKARAFDWLTKQKYGCWGIDSHDGSWQKCIEAGGESYHGKTLLEAVEDAMAKEAKGL